MSRLWFLVLLGWLLIIGSFAYEDELEREHEARIVRECGCDSGVSLHRLSEPERPLDEMLELSTPHVLARASSAGSRLPAPKIDELVLEVGGARYNPVSDLQLTGELPPGAKQLALLFEVRDQDSSDSPLVLHTLALAPADRLDGLGKPRCNTELFLDLNDRVRVAVAAIDKAGHIGQVTTIEAKLRARGPERPDCGHGHCSHSGMLALLLGMCWLLPTFAMMIGTLVVLAHRRSKFRAATAGAMSLGQLHQLCSKISRTQLAYVVLCLLCGAALALRYPVVAPTAVLVLPFALIAALRHRAMQRLLALAERPGASLERRGPGVTVVHDDMVLIETFPSSLMAAAMKDDVPPMRTH